MTESYVPQLMKILDENKQPVTPPDLRAWDRFYADIDNRRVDETNLGDGAVRVSTVFLGTNHGWAGPDMWFETMVFGGRHDEWMDRYTTWEQAEAGHRAVVAALRECVNPADGDCPHGEHLDGAS